MTGTRRRRIGWAGALALALVLAATGAGAGPSASDPAAASTTAAAIGCPRHDRGVCIDRTDDSRTVPVRVGQTVTVALSGATLRWSGLHQVGPALLRRQGAVRQAGAGGLAASYAAVKAGRTTLQAGGKPMCAPGKACPQYILVWQVRLVVR
jgi:hypothetical protein